MSQDEGKILYYKDTAVYSCRDGNIVRHATPFRTNVTVTCQSDRTLDFPTPVSCYGK